MAAANAHHRCGAVNLRSKQSRFYLYLWYYYDGLETHTRSRHKRTPLIRAPIDFYAKVRLFKARFKGEAAIF